VADQPRSLCIVSSEALKSREFIAALSASLHLCPNEPLEIIMDRRHGGPLMESRLEDRRRRQPLVDLALATKGFAIVPASVDSEEDRTQTSPFLARVPIEPDEDDEDLKRLESIRSFLRRKSARPLPRLGDALLNSLRIVQNAVELRRTLANFTKLVAVLIGVTMATIALSPAGQNFGKSVIGWSSQGSPLTSGGQAAAPPAAHLTSTLAQVPAVNREPTVAETQPARIENPAQVRPASESSPAAGAAQTKAELLRDADRLMATPHETSTPSQVTDTTSREPGAASRGTGRSRKEVSAQPNEPTSRDGGGRPGRSATSPSIPPKSKSVADKPLPKAAKSKATPPRFAGSPRVELVREPVSVGWGESYAVRLLNPVGQPMAGVEVWLIARRADGTVENIPMGSLPELGVYRATVPTRRSAPVKLQVRVRNSEQRVDIPVRR